MSPITGDYGKLMETLITGCDLSNEAGRKEAFDRCLRYADEHLGQSLDCNVFLAEAARRLGQTQVMKDVISSIVPVPSEARLHLAYQAEVGPVLSGNVAGLKYLAELILTLAQAPLDGEHVQLDWNHPPVIGDSYGLLVYREADAWFEEGADEWPEDDGPDDLTRNDVKPEEVLAVQFLGELPPGPALRVNRVYLVQTKSKFGGDDVYYKPIREDDSRIWVFSVRDDQGNVLRLGLDLDDPDLNFLTRADLAQFVH